MPYQESETVELKAVVVDEVKKEIIAFANSDGGKLYIGVRDDGTVVGVDDPDGTALQVSNMVRDSIKPDVTMFLHYKTIEEDGKKVIEINVQRGIDRPYYIAKKGMRPDGVYVRQGYSSVPATDTAIRCMIKETDGDRFETMRCLEQELTFEATEQEFRFRKVEFGPQQMRTLKLVDNDGLYSNLALLLSDQNPHTIKVAVFQGNKQMIFKDRREFGGSLMKQMSEVYDYIDFRNQIRATIEKLSRIDVRDYPVIAVREALLNLLVHVVQLTLSLFLLGGRHGSLGLVVGLGLGLKLFLHVLQLFLILVALGLQLVLNCYRLGKGHQESLGVNVAKLLCKHRHRCAKHQCNQ